jgi:hypothetical protein
MSKLALSQKDKNEKSSTGPLTEINGFSHLLDYFNKNKHQSW